jgi:hypothetical protein
VRELIPGECAANSASTEEEVVAPVTKPEAPEPVPAEENETEMPALETDESGRLFPAGGMSDYDDICDAEPPTGDCSGGAADDVAAVPKYYWHRQLQKCAMFNYKGCGGSNIFDSKLECERRCNKAPLTPEDDEPEPGYDYEDFSGDDDIEA